ncbi:unnamed protein product [Brachionus calyciflorus]|uniref:Glycosyltransferase 2-like domain-containing protein n=1 Tax=Brachionus calyciflorus TaxID=104777 RepID=A0A813P0L1_9BILA|nr:unnamed protein product [Brachionus calyciflorus]
MQLKYFGRFQLALQSTTKYVVIFDDDCIPQKRFLEACMHTINTYDYYGILGTKGGSTTSKNHIWLGPLKAQIQLLKLMSLVVAGLSKENG